MHAHYKTLYETTIDELKFYRIRIDLLLNCLGECESLLDRVNPKLLKQVIKNTKERDIIDLSIHNQLICSKSPKSFNS